MNYAGHEKLRADVAEVANTMCDLRARLNDMEHRCRFDSDVLVERLTRQTLYRANRLFMEAYICARARRSTSKVSFAPVAGRITVSPVMSPKFLLRPRAPCRCWDVPQVLRLSRKRGNSSAVSLSRNHRRRPVRKKEAQKRKAVDVRPRSRSLGRNRRRVTITGFQTISRSDRADCDNRPSLCGASPER